VLAFPTRDLDLALAGRDRLVPFASAGIRVAPPALPIELAAAVSTSRDASLRGDAGLGRTADSDYPAPLTGGGGAPAAALRLGMPTTARAGLRVLVDRFLVELDAEIIWLRPAGKRPVWRTSDMSVSDETGVNAELDQIPSLVSLRDHVAVRGAVDLELVPDLLWVSAGYRHTTAATGRSRLSAGFGDVGGHTLSLGAEGSWNQLSFAIGVAHRFSPAVSLSSSESAVEVENPFEAGTTSAGAGHHDRAHDSVGLSIEVAWE
jgi:hypothetical protein